MTIAVTGATGHLGRLVLDALLERDVAPGDLVAVVRDPDKATDLADRGIAVRVADYDDESALRAAFDGIHSLVFVSASEVGKRTAQHTHVVDAAKAAGVGLVAYTSLLDASTSSLSLAEEHRVTEGLLARSGLPTVLLRNGWYWENYGSAVESARATGTFDGAVDGAVVAPAARSDYAEAAAVVVTTDGHAGRTYELVGSEHVSYAQIADILTQNLGRPVEYVDRTEAEYASILEESGLPAPVAEMLAGWDTAIAGGALDSPSTDLQDLLGRPSTPAADILR